MPSLLRFIKTDRTMLSLTGLNLEEFDTLLSQFSVLLYESYCRQGRQRAVGGGRKGNLPSASDKLFYILFYMKVYPTYDLAAFIFRGSRGKCCLWTQKYMPLLEKTLGRSTELPKRKISSVAELLDAYPETKDLFIDGTERGTQRPQSYKIRNKRYSGKKKMHTRKNTIVCDENKRILFVSPTKEGKIHDLTQIKKTGLLQHIPKDIAIWVDKGYQGIKKLTSATVIMPHKKPRKRSMPPDLRTENILISSIRMRVEHAINGIKRYNCLSNLYRNRKGQDDIMVFLAASLWNFHIQCK